VGTRIADLTQVNPGEAKSVILLCGEGESDAHMVKAVLAVARLTAVTEGPGIVAEIDDADIAQALRVTPLAPPW
jgi:hypothetical protein